jgi:hypothetical protein
MLKDLLEKTFQKELSAGEHTAILTAHPYKASDKGPEFDYIAASFIIDNTLSYNRNLFERELSIFLSQVRRQLGRQNEDIKPMEFLAELVKNKTPFKIWVEYKIVPTRDDTLKRVQNVYYTEPLGTVTTNNASGTEPDASEELMSK